jgi:modulator of FtsH protease HflC
MKSFLAGLLVLLGLAALATYSAAFIVHQNETAIVTRFGEPKRVIDEPGLNWKMPVIDLVEFFDKRILDLDTSEQEVTTRGQERLIVDAFTRYKIVDALEFYKNVRNERRVKQVMGPLIESEIRRVLGTANLLDIVKDKRELLMKQIAQQVNKEGKDYGIQVVDVRIKRADLHQSNLKNVFDRMKADRVRAATELRAQGKADANRIQADADRQVTIIKGEATKQSDLIRGEGEGERNRIFAEAFSRDREFFSFYRSMQAYEQSMKAGDTRMLLSPDSDFFRFFQNPSGMPSATAQPKR